MTTLIIPSNLDRSWMTEASCQGVDPDLFYPVKGRVPLEAREICAGCPVQAECLQYSLDHREHWGVWGGLSELDRRNLRRQRNRDRVQSV